MIDFISACNNYPTIPETLSNIEDRFDDLTLFFVDLEKVKPDQVEETGAVISIVADGMYPTNAVNAWWQAFLSDINTYAGVGSRSLVSRRLIRLCWVMRPRLHRDGPEFKVTGRYRLIKFRTGADEPVA
jgi:hypothetical protein